MPKRILVAIDGSDTGERALAFASEFSAKAGGDLTILHVLMHGRSAAELERLAESEHIIEKTARGIVPDAMNLPPSLAEILAHPESDKARAITEIGDYILDGARLAAEEAGARNIQTKLADGDYADAILDAALDLDADLLVVGRRGLGRASYLLLGSVSNKVVQHAKCDVTVVR